MCGRVRLNIPFAEIAKAIDILADSGPAPNTRPSWNTGPTQDVLVVFLHPDTGKRIAQHMRWGMIPRWAKEAYSKYPTHNARVETMREKATYRGPWRDGMRCLVVTTGFYEWRQSDKQPFAIARAKGQLTVMAALWDSWTDKVSGEVVRSCTIVTTTPNSLIEPYHDRMPVVLAKADWPKWLGEEPATVDELFGLLRSYPSDDMELWPVSKRVGNMRNNDPDLEKPISLEDAATLI
jgi:putative SOS response-associated peptidase YedK